MEEKSLIGELIGELMNVCPTIAYTGSDVATNRFLIFDHSISLNETNLSPGFTKIFTISMDAGIVGVRGMFLKSNILVFKGVSIPFDDDFVKRGIKYVLQAREEFISRARYWPASVTFHT